jgi:hypothetical protein
MAIDIESILSGGGTGFVAAILTALGINRRVTKLEDSLERKVDCKIHEEISGGIKEALARIEGRLDDLYQHFMNGRKL